MFDFKATRANEGLDANIHGDDKDNAQLSEFLKRFGADEQWFELPEVEDESN